MAREYKSQKAGPEALAAAICTQAVDDYKRVAYRLMRSPDHKEAQERKAELTRFFLSDWFTDLSNIDGKKALKALNAQMGVD